MSNLKSRIQRLIQHVGRPPCQLCRGWKPPGGIVSIEHRDDPLPYPETCPECGRRVIRKALVGVSMDDL